MKGKKEKVIVTGPARRNVHALAMIQNPRRHTGFIDRKKEESKKGCRRKVDNDG